MTHLSTYYSSSNVDQPVHYNPEGIQPIDAIQSWGLGFELGNAIKYIARAGRKPGSSKLEDLEKAHWYLSRAIEQVRQSELKFTPPDPRKEQRARINNVESKMDLPDCGECKGKGVIITKNKTGRRRNRVCPECKGNGVEVKSEKTK